jgi:hypothetical protein
LPCQQRILRCRFPGTCKTVGQVFKFVWMVHWKINIVCMSLPPFVSFLSRFVTYLLEFPRINNMIFWMKDTLWNIKCVFWCSLQLPVNLVNVFYGL